MNKTLVIRKLMYVFTLLVIVNIFYEVMRFYVQGNFNLKDILSKTILELSTLIITGIVFLRRK